MNTLLTSFPRRIVVASLFSLGLLALASAAQTAPATSSRSQAVAQPLAPSANADTSVQSPDGKIAVQVNTTGALSYRVAVDGVTILQESRLGLRLREAELGPDVSLVRAERNDADTTWTDPFGKRRKVRDHHRELKLTLRDGISSREFAVIFRVFDDGIGFRYALPARADAKDFIVDEELTEFAFTTDNVNYAGDHMEYPPEEYDPRGGFAGSQEWEYRRRRLSDLPSETVTGLPLVAETPAAWLAITEADLLDWSAMWLARAPLRAGSNGVTLRARLAPRLDGNGAVRSSGARQTPWRVLMIGREPGRLAESDLVVNLSTPSQIADTSWIKPGLMAWDRWWSGVGQKDTATMKDFIQLAADMGWAYQLVDGGWYTGTRTAQVDITKPSATIDMPELLRFAKERNVRLWVWLYWTDVDQSDYEKAFALYEQWGLAGVKIDFMDRDDQEMVQWYEKIARAGAKHHLMVNFHGAYKPTGLQRTWPNQITSEGILGNEYNKWSTRATPAHRTTLPFTRFLAGPADYTPGGFLNRTPAKFETRVTPTQVQGTRAGELALFVVYDSPIMCVCDHPSNLRDKRGIDFLKLVPTVWDDTRVLSGAIADHIVKVRRSGNDWFLGALNNATTRVKTVKLDFLGEGRWKLRWWHDARESANNAELIEIEDREVTATDTLNLRMTPGGGAVAHFTRLP